MTRIFIPPFKLINMLNKAYLKEDFINIIIPSSKVTKFVKNQLSITFYGASLRFKSDDGFASDRYGYIIKDIYGSRATANFFGKEWKLKLIIGHGNNPVNNRAFFSYIGLIDSNTTLSPRTFPNVFFGIYFNLASSSNIFIRAIQGGTITIDQNTNRNYNLDEDVIITLMRENGSLKVKLEFENDAQTEYNYTLDPSSEPSITYPDFYYSLESPFTNANGGWTDLSEPMSLWVKR